MSEKCDGIDLNADVISVEAAIGMSWPSGSSSVDGFRILGEANGFVNGVSDGVKGKFGLNSSGLEGGNAGFGFGVGMSNLGFVKWASLGDGFRVLREAKDSAIGVSEGVNRDVGLGSDGLQGKSCSSGLELGINSDGFVSGVKVEGGGNVRSVSVGDGREHEDNRMAEMHSGNVLVEALVYGVGQSERKLENDETNVMGVGNRMKINLVDLNAHHGMCKEDLSGNGNGNNETEVKDVLIKPNVPLYWGGVNDVASLSKGTVLHGNQDAVIKGEMTDVNFESKDGNDLKVAALRPRIRGEECQTEMEGEYYLSDLVWGKVWGHPWWPGQIFEPTAASEKSMKYFKKDSYLIAYFGDQTFSWSETARIKPFRMYFNPMEKQSNLEPFCRAVDCALDEVCRRVEFGLSCSCLPEEQRAKIASQTVVNAGILEGASRRYDRDHISSASTFTPAELLQDVKSLAVAPRSGIDRLDFVIARAQLLAFNRWKGFFELPELVQLHGLSQEDSDIPAAEESLNDHKYDKVEGSRADGKASGTSFDLECDEKKAKGKRGRKKGSITKCKAVNGPNLKRRKRTLSPRVQKGSPLEVRKESQRKQLFPRDIPPEEMLSKLCLAALCPMEAYSSTNLSIGLFCAFRNSVCQQDKNARKRKRSTKEYKGENSSQSEIVESMEDLYWTEEQESSGPPTLEGKTSPILEPRNVHDAGPTLNDGVRDAGVLESEAQNPAVSVDEITSEHSPTALSLKFSDLESVPSVTDLNKIFSRFGPLNQSETVVQAKSKRAKVVFKRRSDAEAAFSSAGKFNLFGPSLLCYRLKPLLIKPPIARRRKMKAAKSE